MDCAKAACRAHWILAWAVVLLPVLSCPAGTLSIGKPVVQNNQYVFPVNLHGNAEGVAALDFRLAYDPAVFSPVSAQTGISAATAQKQVSSNVAEPGEFIVVMMGFNQNVVEPGTVVQVVMEKIGEPANGQSQLSISEPTMATYEGVEVASQGETRVVDFATEEAAEGGEDESPSPTPEPTEESPEAPTEPEPANGARPAGSFKFIVAEPTENKAKPAAGAGSTAGVPAGSAADSGNSNAGTGRESAPGAAADLPPGYAPKLPANADEEAMTLAARPASPGTEKAGAGDATSASLVSSPGKDALSDVALLEEEGGTRGVLFVTLFALAFAVPMVAFLGLKVLRKN